MGKIALYCCISTMITVITTHSTKIIGKINRLLGRTTTTIGLSYCNSTTILNLCCTKFSNNDSQLTLNENFVHCAAGYRSVIAGSLLKKQGINNVINVEGGFGAIKETAIPLSDFICPTTL